MRFSGRNIALLLALLLAAVPVRALAQTEAVAAQPETAAVAAAPAPPPAKARIDIDTSKGYARILFTFQRATAVSASVADSVLTIRSGAELNTTVDNFIEKLGPYVSSGRVDNDGLTYRFALKGPVALHNSAQGNKVVVDLVPDSFKGVPPDLPPPPPPPKPVPPDVAKLPQVKVRVGEYANFTRLVFDWEKQVPYTVYPGRGRISIRFDTLVRPDFSTIERRAPAWVKSAGWHIDGNSTVVDFDTDPESAFHDFRDGTKIAIDVLAPKTDAGSGALEQMVLAEYCAPHFDAHVPGLRRALRKKLDKLMEALAEQFGTAAEFDEPKGGIFLWVKLPDDVDTLKLYQSALKAGVAINPGPEWSTDAAHSRSRMRLCFASPSHEEIREGIAILADICRKEFGVPARSANIER